MTESDDGTKAVSAQQTNHSYRFLLPVLGLSAFSVWLINVVFQLLLIDIAQTFQVNVGTAGLTAAVSAISGIAAGLLLSFLSVRFNHKLLLALGLATSCLSSIALYFAPSFELVLVTNAGVGIAIATVSAMAYSFIGNCCPAEKRGRAIGFTMAASMSAFILGAPVIGFIADWHTAVISVALPFALVSLILVLFAIPNKPGDDQLASASKETFFAGVKQTFSNRSATACLIAYMFIIAETSICFYTVSFFRSQFSVGIDVGSVIVMVTYVLSAAGGIAAGLMVNRVGGKVLATATCLLAITFILTFTFMPTFAFSWALNALSAFFCGMTGPIIVSLTIEQVPKFKSTMASLNVTFLNMGMLLASLSGGMALSLYNYQTLALMLGGFGLAGIVLWVTSVKETGRSPNI